MWNTAKPVVTLMLMGAAFLAGRRCTRVVDERPSVNNHVLFYRDPMHPAYKSDKPGTAPDCGMPLEAVYSDASSRTMDRKVASSPESLHVTREMQQMIGVQIGRVTRGSGRSVARLFGRVAVDESRIVRVVTATDGWVQEVFPESSINAVRKDDLLARFYSREFLSAQEAYIYALNARDRLSKSGGLNPDQARSTASQIRSNEESLSALGLGATQMLEIATSREIARSVAVRAPISGVVLSRNVAVGQRFERNTELYRLVDLSHVWILVDVFENEQQYIRAGVFANIHYQGRTFRARMTDVSPMFDSVNRTLKVRFEADNPDFLLKSEMFVDVDVPLALPDGITVPVDAVVDSGLAKTVYVEREAGIFEPRLVEVGWRFGDRVQIANGLTDGERIVISGNFLFDSERRMKGIPAQQSKVTPPSSVFERDPQAHIAKAPDTPTRPARHD
jgi:Cu(I)/Ag(I) efflux system membrane fusion protein